MIALLIGLLLGFSGPRQAESAYGAGRYGEALALFRAALSDPESSRGHVLYNMGNCAYRLGRHAEAVLYYRRAQLRLPHDPEVAFNLGLAKERLGIEDQAYESFGSAIEAMVDAFTPGELLALAGVLQCAGLVGFVLLRRRRTGRAFMALLVLLSLAGAARLARDQWLPGPPAGVVLADEIALRSEPHAGLAIDFKLEAGETVRVEEWSDRWVRVEHAKGGGWTERAGVGIVD